MTDLDEYCSYTAAILVHSSTSAHQNDVQMHMQDLYIHTKLFNQQRTKFVKSDRHRVYTTWAAYAADSNVEHTSNVCRK